MEVFCLKNCPKAEIWDSLTSWKFEPSPHALWPHHQYAPRYRTKQNLRNYWLSWHALGPGCSSKLTVTLKRFGYPRLSTRKIPHTPIKSCWSQVQYVSESQPTPSPKVSSVRRFYCIPLGVGVGWLSSWCLSLQGHCVLTSPYKMIKFWRKRKSSLLNLPQMMYKSSFPVLHPVSPS